MSCRVPLFTRQRQERGSSKAQMRLDCHISIQHDAYNIRSLYAYYGSHTKRLRDDTFTDITRETNAGVPRIETQEPFVH